MPIERHIRGLDELQFIVFGLGFVVDVEIRELRACFCESPEVFGVWDVWQIAFEVRFRISGDTQGGVRVRSYSGRCPTW